MKKSHYEPPQEITDVYGNSILILHFIGNMYFVYPNKQAYISHKKDKIIEAEYFIVYQHVLPKLRTLSVVNYQIIKSKYQ
tara:strand:+ start:13437 stop:13676 length:240 start_codon:yes stop_codon:yes gene_type:complete